MKLTASIACLFLPGTLVADEGRFFAKFDADGDEAVRYVEFAQKRLREFFALDRDESRTLTPAEFSEAKPAESGNMLALPGFARMDGDGDANVDLKEFGSAVKLVFDTIDAMESGQPDGRVTRSEYRAAVRQKRAAKEAVEAAIASKKASLLKKGSTKAPKK